MCEFCDMMNDEERGKTLLVSVKTVCSGALCFRDTVERGDLIAASATVDKLQELLTVLQPFVRAMALAQERAILARMAGEPHAEDRVNVRKDERGKGEKS